MMMAPTEQALARAKQAIAPLCTASPLMFQWAVPALKESSIMTAHAEQF